MPCFLKEAEISRLENKILNESDINEKERKSKKYEEYKTGVELMRPIITELQKYITDIPI